MPDRIVQFESTGGPEVLKVIESDPIEPQTGEIRVRLKSAGLNRAEYMFMQGQYFYQPKSPSRLGVEGAGIVEAVGDSVSRVAVGDEVCITPNIHPVDYGVLGDWTIVPEVAVVPRPPNLSFAEASAIWMPFGTAYGGLINFGELRRGDAVLIPAASSSVGLAAIQVAKQNGARKVIATTRSSAKRHALLDAGADSVITTDEESLVEMVARETDGSGVDVIFDPVAGPWVEQLAEAAAPGARLVLYGVLSMDATPYPLFVAMSKGITTRAFHLVFHLLQRSDLWAEASKHLAEGFTSGSLKPQIDRQYDLSDIREAYEHLESNQQIGKIVVSTGS